jgi:hypothetical protein
MEWFLRELNVTPQTTVLDVGGTSETWKPLGRRRPRVTLLNIRPEQVATFPQVVCDARNIPFPDKSFDVVFSNSLIEHVGTWEDQQQCAKEMCRVGKRLWVQTPNLGFPVETHLLVPFIHWLPRSVQRPMVPLTPRAFFSDSAETPLAVWEGTRLLGPRQMKTLFPGRHLYRERVFGLTKSLIVS